MPYLRNTWYVAAWAKELVTGSMLRRRLLDEFYVFFRDSAGTARALTDRCPHRFAPLSRGQMLDDGDTIQCPYHGLRFNHEGQCVANPHGDGSIPKGVSVPSLPVVEKYSAIWAWMGEPEKADPALIPDFEFMSPEHNAVACDYISIDAHYELESDNILDLSHIEYIHPLFSSSGVSKGEYECVRDGNTVWSKRFISDDELPPFLQEAFGLGAGETADRWLDARWDAPACMALWTGGVASGKSRKEGREVVGAHIFTPETENRTHYFFGNSFPLAMGPTAQQMADDTIAAATGPEGVFTTEDKPIIEAQAENMLGREFWSLKPMLLSIDAGAVRARRVLAKMIQLEQESLKA